MIRPIDCREFDRRQTEYLDGQLPRELRSKVSSHIENCPRCRERSRGLVDVRAALGTIPAKLPPPELGTQLKVIASRELARRREHASWWGFHIAAMRLTLENLMRPLALPAAGGVISAVLLFGTVAPYLTVPGVAATPLDVPTALYTEPWVKGSLPVGVNPEEIEVELTIDDQGRMIDYSIPESQRELIAKSPNLQRNIETKLLFTIFEPAKFLGQSVSGGKIRLTLRTSTIDVKG